MAADAAVLTFASALAVLLTNPNVDAVASPVMALVPVGPAITIPLLLSFGGYDVVVRFIGADFVKKMAVSMILAWASLTLICAALGHLATTWNVALLYSVMGFGSVILLRLAARHLLRSVDESARTQVLVYGAGSAGRQLVAALAQGSAFRVVGFLDDNLALQGRTLSGIRVHSPLCLSGLRDKLQFQQILLAMPSLTQKRRRDVLQRLAQLPVKVMTLPGLDELASGTKRIDDLREVQIEDLLGRSPVAPDEALLDAPLRDRVVLITGAGGSIGSELSRVAVRRGAKKIILLDNSEYALYSIERELSARSGSANAEIVPVLGSVTDDRLVRSVLLRHRVETVYHAAAYKHVPLVEQNVIAAVQNNVLGTQITAEAALACGVKNLVLVSTDKAVRPTSIMGASKRVCELIIQSLVDKYPQRHLTIVRFGNVLGSSGSVVPLFREQIRSGGPLTVTHPEVTRYFMTITEAAQLVVQAGAMGNAGQVFLLDMGEPVLIRDLAERMIQLAGLRLRSPDHPDGDIDIVYSGLRPGEKLYEELLIGDQPEATSHPRIFRAQEGRVPAQELLASLQRMADAIQQADSEPLLTELHRLVGGFVPPKHAEVTPLNMATVRASSAGRPATRPEQTASSLSPALAS